MKECPSCRACLDDAVEICPIDGTCLVLAFPGAPVIDDRYRVELCLGRGGMGVVYRVRHIGLNRTFALKLIQTSRGDWETFVSRFETEARVLGRLKHPNIVEVTDYGVDPRGAGFPYLVMEYLEGKTLFEVSRKEGPLPLFRALPLLEDIAEGIDYAHGKGVLHRDLKSSNVFITREGSSAESVKILDFGLARLLSKVDPIPTRQDELEAKVFVPGGKWKKANWEDVSGDETLDALPQSRCSANSVSNVSENWLVHPFKNIEGTLAYLAPELIRGEGATSLADIYAFAVTTYEVLVGKLPFSGSPSEVLESHLHSAPPAPSSAHRLLPPELDAPIQAALAKNPISRPKSAGDFVKSLKAAAAIAEDKKWRTREIPRRLGLAVLLTAVLLLLAWPLGRGSFVQELEHRAVDLRFAATPLQQPDPRLLVISVDEASLEADSTPLTERADEFGRKLEAVLAAGARGVAMDFILPEQWSHSEQFSKLILARDRNLTLALLSAPSGEAQGAACVNQLTSAGLGPIRFLQIFGFVNLTEDSDAVTRRANYAFQDAEGNLRDSWAARAASTVVGETPEATGLHPTTRPFWIDFRTDWQNLPQISWKDLEIQLDRNPEIFRGKLVLIGGELVGSGDDYHRIPSRPGQPEATSGVSLQALIVNTILEHHPLKDLDSVPKWIILGLICGVMLSASLCISKMGVPIVIFACLSLGYVGIAVLLFRKMQFVLPVAVPLLMASISIVVGLVLRFWLPAFPRKEGRNFMSDVKIMRSLSLAALLCTIPAAAARGQETKPREFVCVVTNISGQVSLLDPAGKKSPIHLFDWLPASSILETHAVSGLTLVYANGNRYEIGEKTRLSLTLGGPDTLGGSVRTIDPIPPIPRLAAIANSTQAGARAGAIRLRGGPENNIRNMYPRSDCTSLPDSTVLRFDPIRDVSRYQVELMDESGRTFFDAETQSTALGVPVGVLRPSSRYHWRVRTTDHDGSPVQGEEEFSTLSEDNIQQRTALRDALQKRNDAASLALMADVDLRLGLWMEARQGFQAAIAKSSADTAFRQALTEIEQKLEAYDEQR